MNDTTILYAGIFCFALTLLGLVLTIYEFKKTPRDKLPKPEPMRSSANVAAKVSASGSG